MTTAVQIAERYLKRLMVQGADAPLAADEYADFYAAMNSWVAMIEAKGMRLGYTPVSDAADEITVPDGAIMGIGANVAIMVAADYGMAVPPSLAVEASEGMDAIRHLAVHMPQTAMDPNLPVGSGSGSFLTNNPELYGNVVSGTLVLAGNTLPTSMSATVANIVKARGVWVVGDHQGITCDITGRYTAQREADYHFELNLTAKAGGSVAAAFIALVKSGDTTNIPTAQYITTALSTTQSSHVLRVSLRLQPGEYVELWVGDIFGTQDITVTDAVLEVS